MPKQDLWFVEERAFAFVSLALTADDGVKVKRYAGRDDGIDLLVEVLKNGNPTMRYFGAQVVADLDLPQPKAAERRVQSHLGREPFEADLPLCVFVVGARGPEAIYRWVVEPVIEEGSAVLRPAAKGGWEKLDDAGAARIIKKVNDWYDALHRGPAARGR